MAGKRAGGGGRDPVMDLFRGRLKVTRRLHLAEPQANASPRTQIGGTPWWPSALARPRCPRDHSMAFMAQVLLSDVAELIGDAGLLSFHYCVECQEAGNMSFGASDTSNRGYSVVLFEDLERAGDGLGQTVPSPLPSHSVSFSEAAEVPAMEDLAEDELDALPPDYPAGGDDFDEQVWPGVVHVARSKLGGWPHWQQSAEWPECGHGSRMVFAGQLDWDLGENAAWAGGGYAYLFVCPSSCPQRTGELVIQTT